MKGVKATKDKSSGGIHQFRSPAVPANGKCRARRAMSAPRQTLSERLARGHGRGSRTVGARLGLTFASGRRSLHLHTLRELSGASLCAAIADLILGNSRLAAYI